jgi:hypothetical protein
MNYDKQLELLQAKKDCSSLDVHFFELQKAKIECNKKLNSLGTSIKEVESRREVASMKVLEIEDEIAKGGN